MLTECPRLWGWVVVGDGHPIQQLLSDAIDEAVIIFQSDYGTFRPSRPVPRTVATTTQCGTSTPGKPAGTSNLLLYLSYIQSYEAYLVISNLTATFRSAWGQQIWMG